jgi:hypothetical protein
MNYSRGIQPSCSGPVQENIGYGEWVSVKKHKPDTGAKVFTLNCNGTHDKECWTQTLAYYTENGFYELRYDDGLGVLRKYPVDVDFWQHISYPYDGDVVYEYPPDEE